MLHSKYNVEWIPTLIFIDGKTGKVISENGNFIIENDPTGDRFPWKPKPFSEIIAGAKFIDQNDKERTWDELQGKITGLFFSSYSVNFWLSIPLFAVDKRDRESYVVTAIASDRVIITINNHSCSNYNQLS